MGISGLLPFLRDSTRKCNISEFRGCTVVIDSYCWLHKGAFAGTNHIVTGEELTFYVKYCLKYIRLLESNGIKPIMVFDGQRLAAKQLTEQRRRNHRDTIRKRAKEFLRLGKTEEAKRLFQQCVDITHEIAFNLIKECRNRNIDCIVAPYEADAQMAYLNLSGVADLVITEDSDLVMFGCTRVLFKLDHSGVGMLVEKDKLIRSMKMRPDLYSFEKFRHMCIMSGCDYLDSLPGIGLKRAHKAITLTHDPNIYNLLRRLPQYLNLSRLVVPKEYMEHFKLADAALKHQIVYDPLKRELVYLTCPKECGTSVEYLKNAGDMYDNNKAFQMALGNIDPITSKVVSDWNPDNLQMSVNSIWSKTFVKRTPIVRNTDLLIISATTTKDKQAVTTTNINHTAAAATAAEEQEKIDYDNKLEKELKAYYNIKESPKAAVIKPEPNQPNISEDMYKKLQLNNPFLISTPLSKFGATNLEPGKVVRSSYFEKKTDDLEDFVSELATEEYRVDSKNRNVLFSIKPIPATTVKESENKINTKENVYVQKFSYAPKKITSFNRTENVNVTDRDNLSPILSNCYKLPESKFGISTKNNLENKELFSEDLDVCKGSATSTLTPNIKYFQSHSCEDNHFISHCNSSKKTNTPTRDIEYSKLGSSEDGKLAKRAIPKNKDDMVVKLLGSEDLQKVKLTSKRTISNTGHNAKQSRKRKLTMQTATIVDMFKKIAKKE